MKKTVSALVLLGHGSRDLNWRISFESLAAEVSVKLNYPYSVRCAYLQYCTPQLHDIGRELTTQNITDCMVWPIFIGQGFHVNQDVQKTVKTAQLTFPHIKFEVLPTLTSIPYFSSWLAGYLNEKN